MTLFPSLARRHLSEHRVWIKNSCSPLGWWVQFILTGEESHQLRMGKWRLGSVKPALSGSGLLVCAGNWCPPGWELGTEWIQVCEAVTELQPSSKGTVALGVTLGCGTGPCSGSQDTPQCPLTPAGHPNPSMLLASGLPAAQKTSKHSRSFMCVKKNHRSTNYPLRALSELLKAKEKKKKR